MLTKKKILCNVIHPSDDISGIGQFVFSFYSDNEMQKRLWHSFLAAAAECSLGILSVEEMMAADQAGDVSYRHPRATSVIQHEWAKHLAASLCRVPFVSLLRFQWSFPARVDKSLNVVLTLTCSSVSKRAGHASCENQMPTQAIAIATPTWEGYYWIGPLALHTFSFSESRFLNMFCTILIEQRWCKISMKLERVIGKKINLPKHLSSQLIWHFSQDKTETPIKLKNISLPN